MKHQLTIMALSGLLTTSAFTGCGGSANKVENAAENVTEAREELNEAERKFDEEWEKFRLESEERIVANENEITSYREMEKKDPNFSKKYKTRIDELEAKNAEQKAKMYDYKDNQTKERWEEFKREFNHDMDELGTALKDLVRNNKD